MISKEKNKKTHTHQIINTIFKKWNYFKIHMMKNPFQSALIFVFIMWMISSFGVLFFEEIAQDRNIKTVEEAIWWGIVTMLTVGYGDRYPITTFGRIFGGVLMVSGVVGIAIVTAKISSYFFEKALRERRGLVDSSTLKNHFVICGWKEEMSLFLLHILDCNPNIKPSDMVLLNNVPDSEIETLLEIPRLKGLKIIKGDFFIEVNLRRASPETAQKILILADATPNSQGQIPTITEADARTIMTAMTLNNIAKGIPVVAEVLDAAMDQYLRLAQVNEIVYSRNYSRLILAMSSTGLGVTNIFHELLNPHGNSFIATKKIPEKFINQTFGDLQEYYKTERPTETLIGLLENAGNSHVAKEKALRQAQQTPNITQLVKNLQSVKALRFNKPCFAVPISYPIKEGHMAIMIETRHMEKLET